jgi:DNA-directed RNA polymerase
MSETGPRSADRFDKRNRLVTDKKRPRPFIQTPRGNRMAGDLITPLANFLAGGHDVQPAPPPRFLSKLVRELNDPMVLALAALSPLLDTIFRGWNRDDERSAEAKLKLKIGDELYERLYREPKLRDMGPGPVTIILPWSQKQRTHAGNWLLRQALELDVFERDADGHMWRLQEVADKVRERMIAADPAWMPLLKPPPPWTGLWKTYDDGFRAKFVRDWRPETQRAIEDAFIGYFEHADGVNALAQVPLRFDQTMVALVKQFAVKLMGKKGGKAAKPQADRLKVAADVVDAERYGESAIWNDYNCDKRGRIYALQHLNFGREDHVRSLFRFANGAKLNGDTYWLKVHCANCAGHDKISRADRINWVDEHRQDIVAIKADPFGTFDKGVLDGKGWRDADKPFCFVAACREVAAGWDDPNFVTHLPIAFDGTANGLQHLTHLSGDFDAAGLVNLWSDELLLTDDTPSDVYATIIARAIELIKVDLRDHAHWWCERFKVLDSTQQRKLLKQPIMTYAYSVTPNGATRQIKKAYRSFRQNAEPAKGGFKYLAGKVLEACERELRGPAREMEYIRKLTQLCTDQDRFLEWTSPSGFPVSNRYQKPNYIIVECNSGTVRVKHKIADGCTDEIRKKKALNSAAPNFVHSLDAAHLVKTVNAAVSEGITDLLTVHDSYACLAPQATRFHEIITEQLHEMYRDHDPRGDLRRRNDPDGTVEVPLPGTPVKWGDGETAEIVFDLEGVRRAPNAFG